MPISSRRGRRPADPPHGLTTADAVVLALLAEGPRHGHAVHEELERRDVRDWAAVSRPQVYYSIRKLAKGGLLRVGPREASDTGPERQVYRVTKAGRQALAEALAEARWALQRDVQPFQTWLALSPHARPAAARRIAARRRAFLEAERDRERETLGHLARPASPGARAARLMVTLAIRQFELELDWLDDVERELGRR